MEANLKNWLITRPCVAKDRVKIDMRGPIPIAIIGLKATHIRTRKEFIEFVAFNLE